MLKAGIDLLATALLLAALIIAAARSLDAGVGGVPETVGLLAGGVPAAVDAAEIPLAAEITLVEFATGAACIIGAERPILVV
jgi:hypothetical protein